MITPDVQGTLELNGWYRSDVTVSWDVSDPESAISSTSGCDPSTVTTDTTGVTVTCTATSAGGEASVSTTVMRDVTPPTVNLGDLSPPANPAGWNNTKVTVGFFCADDTSGSNQAGLSEVAQEGIGLTAGGSCTDLAGNFASSTSDPFNIDTTPPTITIASPVNGAVFIQNEAIVSDYSCADVLSGVASCTGPVLSGANVVTTALGNQNFTVTGTDVADNTTSVTHTYSVITVSTAVVNLIALVESFNLQQGLENSLDTKLANLQAALDASNAGQRQNAINLLQAFLNEVEAQRGKKLTDEQADMLVMEVNRILATLQQ